MLHSLVTHGKADIFLKKEKEKKDQQVIIFSLSF
jgi:hypothetical protein